MGNLFELSRMVFAVDAKIMAPPKGASQQRGPKGLAGPRIKVKKRPPPCQEEEGEGR